MPSFDSIVRAFASLRHDLALGKTILDVNFLWKEERVRLLAGSSRTSTTPSYSPRTSTTLIYSPGASTTPSYSPRSSKPLSYSLGSSRNAECLNCIILLGKIKVLKATVEMYWHLEQHIINSTALLHEVYNDMGKLGLG
nr:hypothetical protein [Tanacetum cinerariifolium]